MPVGQEDGQTGKPHRKTRAAMRVAMARRLRPTRTYGQPWFARESGRYHSGPCVVT